jgi:MFS family permease
VPILATEWLSIVFLLAFAITIPISSWLGDRCGLKKVYIIAILLFGFFLASSLLADIFYILSLIARQGISIHILIGGFALIILIPSFIYGEKRLSNLCLI